MKNLSILVDTSEILQQIIIKNYCMRKMNHIKGLIKNAVFYSGIDWASLAKPREIRPYCFQILHYMVYIHATISEVSKSLVNMILPELVTSLAQELLINFRKVDRYNVPGMLQGTLEVEFLHNTLKIFENKQSEMIFTNIYDSLEKATDVNEKVDTTRMNDYLFAVKGFLNEAKTGTLSEFKCFGTDQ
ncbi:hypothetical protein HDV02_006331 [Globomyces sp. JEL0801]|nr:hypothetical protein HDV02_006331 [Globomyces sp. JEL0801]